MDLRLILLLFWFHAQKSPSFSELSKSNNSFLTDKNYQTEQFYTQKTIIIIICIMIPFKIYNCI